MQNMNNLILENIEITGSDQELILEFDYLFLEAGEKIGVKGPSGAGKSTLLNLIAGLVSPSKGKVLYNDIEISKLNQSKKDEFRRHNIGMIFQNFLLFEELNAYENASISACFNKEKIKEIQNKAQKYLNFFNLDSSNRDVSSYSGGERQRIAIARALSTNSQIILADEPTASLDKKNASILINDLCQVSTENKNLLIVVSHDDEMLSKMDRIINIVDGKIESIQREQL